MVSIYTIINSYLIKNIVYINSMILVMVIEAFPFCMPEVSTKRKTMSIRTISDIGWHRFLFEENKGPSKTAPGYHLSGLKSGTGLGYQRFLI